MNPTKPARTQTPAAPCACNDALLLGACCCAIATLLPVALYQCGALRSLPDPPSRIFDSERITSSRAAHPFGVPDGVLGIASFGTTLALILLARSRARALRLGHDEPNENEASLAHKHARAKRLLGAKLALDASAAAFNAGRQVLGFGKLCSWCTATALSAGVMACAGRSNIRETARCAVKSSPTP